MSWKLFVQQNYDKVRNLPNLQRLKKLSEMYKKRYGKMPKQTPKEMREEMSKETPKETLKEEKAQKENPQDLKVLAKNILAKRKERLERFEKPSLNVFQRNEKARLLEKAKIPFVKEIEKQQEVTRNLALKAEKDLEKNQKKQALEDIKILLADINLEMKKPKNQTGEAAMEEVDMQEPAMGEPAMGEQEPDIRMPAMAVQEPEIPTVSYEQRDIIRQIIDNMVQNEEQFKTENSVKQQIEKRYKEATGENRMPTNVSKLYPVLFRQSENESAVQGENKRINLPMQKRTGKIVGRGLRFKRGRGRPPKPKPEADVKVEKRPVGRPRKTPYVMPELKEPRKVGKPRLKKTMIM